MKTPRITAVIPTYKRPELLKKTICSVLDQTYPYFKICVYDNTSGDETVGVVSALAQKDDRIEYYCHDKNIGALRNFHFGISNVKTEYFSIICDDDFLLPNCYEVCMKEFEKYPEAMFCSVGTVQMVVDRRVAFVPIMQWKEGVYSPPNGFMQILKKGHPIWTGTLFRSSIIKDIGNVDLATSGHSDFDFDLRIAANGKFIIKKEICAVYRSHSSNATSNLKFDDIWPAFSTVIENVRQNKKLPLSVVQKAEKILSKRLAEKLMYISAKALIRRNYSEIRKSAKVFREYLENRSMAFVLYGIASIDSRISLSKYFVIFASWIKWTIMAHIRSKFLRKSYEELSKAPELKKYL